MFGSKDKRDIKEFLYASYHQMLSQESPDLSEVNKDKLLSDEDEIKLQKMLPTFQFVIFNFLTIQYCKNNQPKYSESEILKQSGNQLCSVLHYQLNQEMNIASKTTDYFIALQNDYILYNEQHIHEKGGTDTPLGTRFHFCRKFSLDFESNNNDEISRTRQFIAFDLAKQILNIQENVFKVILKHVKLI